MIISNEIFVLKHMFDDIWFSKNHKTTKEASEAKEFHSKEEAEQFKRDHHSRFTRYTVTKKINPNTMVSVL